MFTQIFDLASRFGLIDKIAQSALSQPDKAAAKLGDVLHELVTTLAALDTELVRYLSLHFGSDESITAGRAVLLGMEVGQTSIRINEARGHCHKIKNIYDTYLEKWFDRVLVNAAERNEVRTIFGGLGSSDDYIVSAMQEVSDWLKVQAALTLDAVDAGTLADANYRIAQGRLEARPARQALTDTMVNLLRLQAHYIAIAAIV